MEVENKVQQSTGQLSKLEEEKKEEDINKEESEEEGLKAKEIGRAQDEEEIGGKNSGMPMEAWMYAQM